MTRNQINRERKQADYLFIARIKSITTRLHSQGMIATYQKLKKEHGTFPAIMTCKSMWGL